MTAVTRLADASFAAWIMISSSIRCRSTGSLPVWTMKRSAPRTDSSKRQYVSPSANVFSVTSPSSMPSRSAIRPASSGFDRPEKSMSRFDWPSSFQWPGTDCVAGGATSTPGSSVVPLLANIALLRLLPGRKARERVRRHVVCDRRVRRRPGAVADLHWRDERVVDPDLGVPADLRPSLPDARLVREIRGDRAGADVGSGSDLGVAQIRQMRHLRPLPDVRLL